EVRTAVPGGRSGRLPGSLDRENTVPGLHLSDNAPDPIPRSEGDPPGDRAARPWIRPGSSGPFGVGAMERDAHHGGRLRGRPQPEPPGQGAVEQVDRIRVAEDDRLDHLAGPQLGEDLALDLPLA